MSTTTSQPDDNSSVPAAAAGTASAAVGDAPSYEATHVHAVYDAIAPHFSATRHKPWPRVVAFLDAQPPGSVGLDVGCGNGKYLSTTPHHLLGSDRSEALVRLARARSSEVIVADGLALPYRRDSVDFVISIAVLHHLSTTERRREAITALLECVRPGKPVLLYVWALEQASSRRGWDEGSDQDTLVPWVMRAPRVKGEGEGDAAAQDKTYQRYYHLFRKGELEDDVMAAGGQVVDGGYEKDNWWVVCTRQGKT